VDTVAAWTKRLAAVAVPAGAVGDLGNALALAESLGLEPLAEVGGDVPQQVRHPVTYSATPVTSYGPPPRLGEHNAELRRWLAVAPPIEETPR